jgi:hypothetical protein
MVEQISPLGLTSQLLTVSVLLGGESRAIPLHPSSSPAKLFLTELEPDEGVSSGQQGGSNNRRKIRDCSGDAFTLPGGVCEPSKLMGES